jgi:hypothetical protein
MADKQLSQRGHFKVQLMAIFSQISQKIKRFLQLIIAIRRHFTK